MPWASVPSSAGRQRRPQPRRAQRAGAETEHVPAGELRHARKIPQDRLPIRAALSASNHHSDGNPDEPYFGSSARPAETVPARGSGHSVVPLRHDIVIPQQHAIERLGRGDQVVAVLGEDHAVDQLIDRGILDADDIARAGHDRRPAIPNIRAARCPATTIRPRSIPPYRNPSCASRFSILRRIDGAHARRRCQAAPATA